MKQANESFHCSGCEEEFQAKIEAKKPLNRLKARIPQHLKCRFGFHNWTYLISRGGNDKRVCWFCMKKQEKLGWRND